MKTAVLEEDNKHFLVVLYKGKVSIYEFDPTALDFDIRLSKYTKKVDINFQIDNA